MHPRSLQADQRLGLRFLRASIAQVIRLSRQDAASGNPASQRLNHSSIRVSAGLFRMECPICGCDTSGSMTSVNQ